MKKFLHIIDYCNSLKNPILKYESAFSICGWSWPLHNYIDLLELKKTLYEKIATFTVLAKYFDFFFT